MKTQKDSNKKCKKSKQKDILDLRRETIKRQENWEKETHKTWRDKRSKEIKNRKGSEEKKRNDRKRE